MSTRLKDWAKTTSSPTSPNDAFFAVDGSTDGSTRMLYSDLLTDVAAKYAAAPTAYNNATLHTDGLLKADQVRFSGLTFLGTSTVAALPNPNTIPAGNFYITTTSGVAYTKTFVAGESAISDGTNYSVGPNPTQVVANGGTGATTAAAARTNLDLYSTSDANARDLTKTPSNSLHFDGVNDRAGTADSALLSFNTSGATDLPFSGSAIIRVDDIAGQFQILGKEFGTSQMEYSFRVTATGFVMLVLRDISAAVYAIRTATSGALTEGKQYHVAFTYDGAGGASAMDSVNLYVNGALQTATSSNNANYVAMEDGTAGVTLGTYITGGIYGEGTISSCSIYNRELTAAEVLRLSINGNVPEVSDQWGNDTEILSNPGFEVWDSPSGAGTWNEGASITVAQDSTNKYSGSYACHYTSSGSGTTSGASHQLRQGDLVPVGQNYASVIVKNAAAGAFSIGVNNDRFLTFDGTSLTDTSSEVTSQYPGSSLNNYRLTDLGSGWFRIDLWFLIVSSAALDFVLGGTGQWYIDDASNKKSGAVLSLNPDNIVNSRWIDSSTNILDGTITGATAINNRAGSYIHSPSDAATDVVEDITAGASSTVLSRRYGNGLLKGGVHAQSLHGGSGYDQLLALPAIANAQSMALASPYILGGLPRGFVTFTNSSGSGLQMAIFALQGSNGAPVIVSDPFNTYSNAVATSGRINVFYDSSLGAIAIENLSGASISLTVRLSAHYLA